MKRVLIIPLLFIAFALSAAPIGERKAREIATSFFTSSSTRSTSVAVDLEWAGDNLLGRNIAPLSATKTDEAMLYVYNRTDAEGFVVIAGDDGVEKQIVAFSHDNKIQVDNLSDGARFMLDGWCKQIAAARAGIDRATRAGDGLDVGTVEKLYATALWNQGKPFNDEAPSMDGYRAVTGCVATAMSIICHYNKWPEKGVGTTPAYKYYDKYSNLRQIPANTLGRTYDYANMRSDNYENGYSSEEGAAVAAIMKDMGTSVQMMYHYEESGAYTTNVPVALSTYFGYVKSAQIVYGDGYTTREWTKALKANIAKYGPTYLSGSSKAGGHAFVLDGYTSAGYIHINYGWGGIDNGYYLMPKIEYSGGQEAIFELEPDKDGTSTYRDKLLFYKYPEDPQYQGLTTDVTTYETGKHFWLTFGYIWNAGTQQFNGTVRISLCDKDGKMKEVLYETPVERLNPSYLTAGITGVTINSTLASGDRLRAEFKGKYSEDWQWIRAGSQGVTEEIVVSLEAQDIAKSLGIKFDKKSRQFTFVSSYDLTYEVLNGANSSKASGSMQPNEAVTIDASTWFKGSYKFCFRRDAAEYVLTIQL